MDLRYPTVSVDGALYESVYSVITNPVAAEALWIRTTVRKRPGELATGSAWVTWFADGAVRAGKLVDLELQALPDAIQVGEIHQGLFGSRGALTVPGLDAKWDLRFDTSAAPLHHLPKLLYSAPLPRTKATSPMPSLVATGSVAIGDDVIDIRGWHGMLGHNWGSEHAARWAWLRAGGLGADGAGWLDAILGRVRIAGRLTPWMAFGELHVDGSRHRLGGVRGRRASVEVRADGAVVELGGPDVRATVRVAADLDSTVGWEYADPRGARHEVVNCSVAEMELDLTWSDRRSTMRPTERGVLELGGDERAWAVPLQPFGD